MLAKIIVGQTIDQIKEYLQKSGPLDGPDILTLGENQDLKIEQVRTIRPFLSLKPFQGTKKTVIILNAQDLSPTSQNSLLKTIEELGDHQQLFLGVTNLNPILPTILSRCQLVYLIPEAKEMDKNQVISGLAELSIEERLKIVEKTTDKLKFLLELSNFYQTALAKNPTLVHYCQQILLAQSWFQSNVNPRAILEYLMLRLPEKS